MTTTTTTPPSRSSQEALWELAVSILRDQAAFFRTRTPGPPTQAEKLAYGLLVAHLGPSEAEMWMKEMGL